IAIEGNIGCGKSTMMSYFERNFFNAEVVYEPVKYWSNLGGYNALELMYRRPSEYAFLFNNYTLLTRQMIVKDKPKKQFKFIERSLHSTYNIFIQNAYDCGDLTKSEFLLLQNIYTKFSEDCSNEIDLILDNVSLIFVAISSILLDTEESLNGRDRITLVSRFSNSSIIYLRARPLICYQRLINRNRPEESGIPLV
ncbi:hypothetical protein A3Q56_07023, partial [Intoshia linei]